MEDLSSPLQRYVHEGAVITISLRGDPNRYLQARKREHHVAQGSRVNASFSVVGTQPDDGDDTFFGLKSKSNGELLFVDQSRGLRTAHPPQWPLNQAFQFYWTPSLMHGCKSKIQLRAADGGLMHLVSDSLENVKDVLVQKEQDAALLRMPHLSPPYPGLETELHEQTFTEAYITLWTSAEDKAGTRHKIIVTGPSDEDPRCDIVDSLADGEVFTGSYRLLLKQPLNQFRRLRLLLEPVTLPIFDPWKMSHLCISIEYQPYYFAECHVSPHTWVDQERPFQLLEPFHACTSCLAIPMSLPARLLELPNRVHGSSLSTIPGPIPTATRAVNAIQEFVKADREERRRRSDPLAHAKLWPTDVPWTRHAGESVNDLSPYEIAARCINLLRYIHDQGSQSLDHILNKYFEVHLGDGSFLSQPQVDNMHRVIRDAVDKIEGTNRPSRSTWALDHRFRAVRSGDLIGPQPLELAVIGTIAATNLKSASGRSWFDIIANDYGPLSFSVNITTFGDPEKTPYWDSRNPYSSRNPPVALPIDTTLWDFVDDCPLSRPDMNIREGHLGVQVVVRGQGDDFVIAIHPCDPASVLEGPSMDSGAVGAGSKIFTQHLSRDEIQPQKHKERGAQHDMQDKFFKFNQRRRPRNEFHYHFAHAHFGTIKGTAGKARIRYGQSPNYHGTIADGHTRMSIPPNVHFSALQSLSFRNNPHAFFEFAEHTFLGDGIRLQITSPERIVAAKSYPLSLPNGLAVTYGQISGLAGDFYGTYNPISDGNTPIERTSRFKDAWSTLAESLHAPEEATHILAILQDEVEMLHRAVETHQDPRELYERLRNKNVELQYATLRRPSHIPSYLKLASINWDHFGEDARHVYDTGHTAAMEVAISGNLDLAYAMNAFADHFLQDSFSAGHMRTPRRQLHGGLPNLFPDLCAKYMHDEENAIGLLVENSRGDKWRAYGDKRAFSVDSIANRSNLSKQVKIITAAVQISADEVFEAYTTKVRPKRHTAWDLAPRLDLLADIYQQELAPLFVMQRGYSAPSRRAVLANRKEFKFTQNYWYGTTSNLCRSSKLWEYPQPRM